MSKQYNDPPPSTAQLMREDNLPVRLPPAQGFNICASRFGFINRASQQRIESYTGVVRAATELIGAQTELQKATARLLNVGQEIEREVQLAELENLRLANQIEAERRKERLSALEERRDRARLEQEIRTLAPQAQHSDRPSPEHERQRILVEAQELKEERDRVLLKLTQGKGYDELSPSEQERYDRVHNTYEHLVAKKLEELERT